MLRNVLDLHAKAANRYFRDQENYLTIDLPPYFKFDRLLASISQELAGKSVSMTQLNAAKKTENVNHVIYGNKGGKYGWRKLQLMNPLLYISLVNALTGDESWKTIINRFNELNRNKSIRCMSIPALPHGKQSQKATQITKWFDEVEKESIRLALDYEYMFQTDISNCYGSIYTHSIAWALHGKTESKKYRNDKQLLGNIIDSHLQAMSYGQTNGIPQGSVLMNFIAEIVLAYADNQLSEKLINLNINDNEYCILRFRDDYRIFVCNPHHGEILMNALSQILADLGMSLNTAKTKESMNIVIDSIKPEKFVSLHEPNLKIVNYQSLRKELLLIYELGTIYPNNGSILTRLSKINEQVEDNLLQGQYIELISILINIAFYNQRSFPLVAALISRAIARLNNQEKDKILNRLYRKISLLPNLGLLEIWLQRITIRNDFKYIFKEKLCLLLGDEKIELFNNTWNNNPVINSIFDNIKIIDNNILNKLDNTISQNEVRLFNLY